MADNRLISVDTGSVTGVYDAAKALDAVAGGYRNLSREMYRYTFYAVAAIRVGSALIHGAILKGLVGAATAGQDALDRLGAITEEASQSISEFATTANQVAMTTPQAFTDIVLGMEMLYRAGLSLDEVQASIGAVAKMATISGRSLVTEAEFIATILTSFRDTLGENGAANAVDQLAMAARMSRYWFGDLEQALSNCMATAAALNQNLAQTLTVLTAFAQKGIQAAQAGTLLNRTLSQMGNPRVIEFFEEALRYYPELMATEGRPAPVAPALFTPAGLGDVGAVMVAAAEVYKKAIESVPEEFRAEAQKALLVTLSEVFGIRGIRGFLALAEIEFPHEKYHEEIRRLEALGYAREKAAEMARAVFPPLTGLEAYNAMLKQIENATASTEAIGASQEYLNRLYGTWQYTRSFFANMADTLKRTLGLPIINTLNPVIRLLGEGIAAFAKFGSSAEGAGKDVARFISTMVSLGGTLTVVGGAIGLFWGLLKIWSGRFWDIGSKLKEALATQEIGAGAIAGGRFTVQQLLAMRPDKLGLTYMFGGILGPLSLIGKIVGIVAAGFLMWKFNLGGVADRIRPIVDWVKRLVDIVPGKTGVSWGERLNALVSPEQTTTGKFFGGIVDGLKKGLAFIGRVLSVIYDAVTTIVNALSWVYNTFLKPILTGIAFIAGLGNVEEGWRRIGEFIGTLISLSAAAWLITSTGKLVKTFGFLRKFLIGLYASFTDVFFGKSFFRLMGSAVIKTGAFLLKSGLMPATGAMIQLVGDVIKRSNMQIAARAFIPLVKFLFRSPVAAAQVVYDVFVQLATVVKAELIPALVRVATYLWTHLIIPLGKLAGGFLASALGMSAGGGIAAASAAGGLMAILPLALKIALPLLLTAGIAYAFYRLFGPKQAKAAEVRPVYASSAVPVTVSPVVGYAPPATQNITFSPVIHLKEGTPQEHANQILAVLQHEAPRYFRDEITRLGIDRVEDEARRGVLPTPGA